MFLGCFFIHTRSTDAWLWLRWLWPTRRHSESLGHNWATNLRVAYFYVRLDDWNHLGGCNDLDVLRTCLSWKVKTLDRILSLEKSSILDFVKIGKNIYTYKFCCKTKINFYIFIGNSFRLTWPHPFVQTMKEKRKTLRNIRQERKKVIFMVKLIFVLKKKNKKI